MKQETPCCVSGVGGSSSAVRVMMICRPFGSSRAGQGDVSLIDSQSAELLANWAVLTVQESHAAPSGRGGRQQLYTERESLLVESSLSLFLLRQTSVRKRVSSSAFRREKTAEGLEKKSLLSSLRFDVWKEKANNEIRPIITGDGRRRSCWFNIGTKNASRSDVYLWNTMGPAADRLLCQMIRNFLSRPLATI